MYGREDVSTCATLKYERDQTAGREIHLYLDAEQPGYVLLDVEGIPFEIEGAVRLWTAYPSSRASKHGLPQRPFELSSGGPTRITLKFPEEWARKLGLIEKRPEAIEGVPGTEEAATRTGSAGRARETSWLMRLPPFRGRLRSLLDASRSVPVCAPIPPGI
jgi:hypothetical protein